MKISIFPFKFLTITIVFCMLAGNSVADDSNASANSEKAMHDSAKKIIIDLISSSKKPDWLTSAMDDKMGQNIDWKAVKSFPRYSFTPSLVKTTFGKIDIKSIKFQDKIYPGPNNSYLLRLIEPFRYDFEFQKSPDGNQLKLIGIHP